MDPGNTNSWHPPSSNQSHIPTDAVQQAGPSSAPDIHTFQGGSRYAEFPWTAEPQDMSTPVPSIPELTHRLSKTSEMDNKSTPGNRLQRASTSTLISATPAVARPRPGPAGKAQGGSGHENFPWASEPQIPMSVPFAQSRPPPSRRFSEYTAMLLAQDKISLWHTIFIKFFVWILLAGFLVLPAAFARVQNTPTGNGNEVETQVIGHLQHLPFFVVGCACGGIGILGMCWFWFRWHANYVWIISNIFIPGALSAIQGAISTLATIYGQTGKLEFVGTSKWTLIATAGVTGVCGVFFVFYYFFMLGDVQDRHDKEYGEREAGRRGEGTGFETRRPSTLLNIVW